MLNAPRYCLCLRVISQNELKNMLLVYQRVKAVRNFPTGNYITIPKTSSEKRFYIPIGFLDDSVVCADSLRLVSNAELYHFGVLTSSIHMTWLRTVGGRLKSDYRYSKNIVYNNFIWCEPTDKQKKVIEQSAQNILDIRVKYPDATFADLYDEVIMPYDLRDAHKKNDRAVAVAYEFENILDDEPSVVVKLFNLYKRFTD